MAENIENYGCSQRVSAEHEGYAKALRSFNRIWKETDSAQPKLLEAILYKDYFNKEYKRVKANKGALGIDGMTIAEVLPYLREHQQELTDRIRLTHKSKSNNYYMESCMSSFPFACGYRWCQCDLLIIWHEPWFARWLYFFTTTERSPSFCTWCWTCFRLHGMLLFWFRMRHIFLHNPIAALEAIKNPLYLAAEFFTGLLPVWGHAN